jgi:hypothetical protein
MEKQLTFLFIAILVALAWREGIDILNQEVFSNAAFFRNDWFLPYVVAPAVILAAIAFALGFYRPSGRRGPDVIATLILAAIVILTVPTSYSCGSGCF